MFFHIGDRKIISSAYLVGIFNINTLKNSEENINYLTGVSNSCKSLIILFDNKKIESRISPFTLLKRNEIKDGIVWRKDYGK